jgi:hypothetical protein
MRKAEDTNFPGTNYRNDKVTQNEDHFISPDFLVFSIDLPSPYLNVYAYTPVNGGPP